MILNLVVGTIVISLTVLIHTFGPCPPGQVAASAAEKRGMNSMGVANGV